MLTIKGSVAVITGGAGMLGQQHAEVLSDAGAHVVIADISQQISDPVAERITKRNNIEALGVEVDITSEASVNLMVDKIIKKFSRVDILINNAAVKPKNIFNRKFYNLSRLACYCYLLHTLCNQNRRRNGACFIG